MEPPTRRQNTALAAAPPAAAPVIDPADRISKLPEEVQAQILSFLPADEAVRTCVLARTWRHVWRFTRRLLITGKSAWELRESMDRLLRVRRDGLQLASLDAGEIRFDPWVEVEDGGEADLDHMDGSLINIWTRQVLKCGIQTLRVDIPARTHYDAYLRMDTTPVLVSQHLTRLELRGVLFDCRCINLDGCPALEHVGINECCLEFVRKITSLSLKCLVITSSESNSAHSRIQICVPRLVSLWLDNDVRTPLLERMQELVVAKVDIGSYRDYCSCEDPMDCYHVTRDGDTSDIDSDSNDEEVSGDYTRQNTTKCVVLEGLAQAKDLVLKVDNSKYTFRRDLRWCPTFSKLKTLVLIEVYWHEPAECSCTVLACMLEHAPLLEKLTLILNKYIFRRDLRWCPTFSKLKTLVLIEVYWREPAADCSALACMLEHAPLLEKLTLTFDKVPRDRGKYKVEMKGYPDAKVKSTKILQHLQTVEINCEDFSERFLSILNFLCTLNICFETRVTKK